MLIEELVLHNFGVYQGRHVVSLAPPSQDKPIVLIGGLNGGGKTTFLDAIQLSLYGKRARCSNRGQLSYEEYLRRSIHRGTQPSEGAAVQIQFRHRTEGVEHTYRVNRSWASGQRGVTEKVEVVKDGQFDRRMTDGWPEMVEEFVPVGISHLFFFDGEKVEGFAESATSAQLLSSAIQSLLGLDLVERLATDLVVIERRKRAVLKNDDDRRSLETLQQEKDRLEKLGADLMLQQGELGKALLGHERRQSDIEDRFRKDGAHLYQRRSEVEGERSRLAKELRDVESELRELTGGSCPLLLVTDLLAAVDKQDQDEGEAEYAEKVNQLLEQRDQRLLAVAEGARMPAGVLKKVQKYLAEDRGKRFELFATTRYLNLSKEAREALKGLRGIQLGEARGRAERLVKKSDELQVALDDLDRLLASIPNEAAVEQIIKDRQEARAAVEETRLKLEVLAAEMERVGREQNQLEATWANQYEKILEKGFEQDEAKRLISHSLRVQQTLTKFRRKVTERHVDRIAHLVLDSFRQLLRKESLVTDLKIDAEHFTINMLGANGQVLSPDRLSAGERQLLAVSILWGLARASGRPLPAIIDTPLGRLDSAHRSNLIERYFPYASHQVLLLSTNEEIDGSYYETLKPWVGHSYHLRFDDAVGGTKVERGYFW